LNKRHNIQSDIEDSNLHPAPEGNKNYWGWVRFGLFAFVVMIIYIYNSNHATKALKQKNKLNSELKELNAEKVFLESQVTNASKQTEVAKKLKETGLGPLTNPPIKIEKEETK